MVKMFWACWTAGASVALCQELPVNYIIGVSMVVFFVTVLVVKEG